MKLVFFTGVFFLSNLILSQGVYTTGARNLALSNATVAHSDEWFYFNNPGAIQDIKKFSVGVSYENRFLLREMQSESVVGVIPLKKGILSIGSQIYGYTQFRSFKTGVGYALPLAEFLSAGVQLNYQGVRLNQNYGNANAMTAEFGVLSKLNKKVSIGFSIFNIGSAILDDYEYDRYSNEMRLGVRYQLSNKVMFLSEIEKNSEYPLNVKFSTEYLPADNVYLRGGFSLQPVSYSFGLGYVFAKSVMLDFGTSYHQFLGWSPAVSCSYKFH